MKLKVGEILPFDSLLAGLVVQNANDAALVLASAVGGNISSFVESMNERAKALGMENSYYSNPTGVDSATMYTTLSDVLTLCRAVYRVNDFMLLSENPKVTIPATNLTEERVYTNKNALVPYSYVTDYYMKDVRGMVAGYTPRAGYCVATVREKNGCKNLVILSGGTDRSEKGNGTDISSYREAKSLLEWAEETFTIREVIPKGLIACEKKVRLASGVDHMILVSGESLERLLPVDADLTSVVRTEIRTDKDHFRAPIIEGKSYGEMVVYYEEEEIGTIPLVARNNIGLSRWLVAWDAIVGFFSTGPAKVFLILVILGAVGYVLYLFLAVWVQYKKRNRDRRRAIAELMEMENQRMKQVRREERRANQARMRRVRGALRAGFQVLQGDTELMEERPVRKAPTKAVARVPEKYRTRPTQTPPRPVARNTETYRVRRPASSRSVQNSERRNSDPSRGKKR